MEGEYIEPLTVGEIIFDKSTLTANDSVKASAAIENKGLSDVPVNMMIALYNKDGVLKELKTEKHIIRAGITTESSVIYELPEYEEGDYVKAFLWNDLENMKPLTAAKKLSNN